VSAARTAGLWDRLVLKATKLLLPGECEIVQCSAELKGGGNIFVNVDPEDKIADCHPGNNLGAGALGICPG